jgi:intracellular multiplication protein IcmD
MKRLILLLLLLPMSAAYAVLPANANDLGVAASNINDIIAFIYSIIDVILYIAALILGLSGLMKYRLHRRNPQQVPLSTPVTELAIAAVFIILGVLAEMSESYKAVSNPGSVTIPYSGY